VGWSAAFIGHFVVVSLIQHKIPLPTKGETSRISLQIGTWFVLFRAANLIDETPKHIVSSIHVYILDFFWQLIDSGYMASSAILLGISLGQYSIYYTRVMF
jgi:hypothetical protein